MRRALALVLAAGLALTGCSHPSVAPGQARLTVAKGAAATVIVLGKAARPVTGQRTLHRGDRVKVSRGSATLTLPGQATLELRGPRGSSSGSDVQVAASPALLAGDVLARRDSGPLTVTAGGSKATVRNGAARISRTLSVTAAAYAGEVMLSTTGRTLAVPAYRQATIPVLGVLPGRPSPLALDATDPWDNRFLGLAIDLSQELQQESDGFSSNLATAEARSVGFFKQILPSLAEQPAFGSDLIDPARAPGETLVGAAIAVTAKRGDFGSRWSSVFGFRNDGAAWGLVALDQGVTDAPGLSSTVQAALGRATFKPATVGSSQLASGPGAQPGGTSPSSGPTTTTTRPTTQPGGPPTTQPSSGPIPAPPVTTPVDPVLDPIVKAINNLLGG